MRSIRSLLGLKEPRVKFFASRFQARKACRGSYEDDDLVAVVAQKTLNYSRLGIIDQGNAQILYPLQRCLCHHDRLRVLDFGGGCGIHFIVARAVFGDIFDWQIVETPAMVKAGRNLGFGDLTFHERIRDTFWRDNIRLRPHIILSLGAIPYTSSPYASLISLTQVGASFLYIARMALADREQYGIQWSRLSENGPGPMPEGFTDRDVYYPLTILAKDDFEKTLTGYRISRIFDQGVFIPGIHQYGYLCELTNSQESE